MKRLEPVFRKMSNEQQDQENLSDEHDDGKKGEDTLDTCFMLGTPSPVFTKFARPSKRAQILQATHLRDNTKRGELNTFLKKDDDEERKEKMPSKIKNVLAFSALVKQLPSQGNSQVEACSLSKIKESCTHKEMKSYMDAHNKKLRKGSVSKVEQNEACSQKKKTEYNPFLNPELTEKARKYSRKIDKKMREEKKAIARQYFHDLLHSGDKDSLERRGLSQRSEEKETTAKADGRSYSNIGEEVDKDDARNEIESIQVIKSEHVKTKKKRKAEMSPVKLDTSGHDLFYKADKKLKKKKSNTKYKGNRPCSGEEILFESPPRENAVDDRLASLEKVSTNESTNTNLKNVNHVDDDRLVKTKYNCGGFLGHAAEDLMWPSESDSESDNEDLLQLMKRKRKEFLKNTHNDHIHLLKSDTEYAKTNPSYSRIPHSDDSLTGRTGPFTNESLHLSQGLSDFSHCHERKLSDLKDDQDVIGTGASGVSVASRFTAEHPSRESVSNCLHDGSNADRRCRESSGQRRLTKHSPRNSNRSVISISDEDSLHDLERVMADDFEFPMQSGNDPVSSSGNPQTIPNSAGYDDDEDSGESMSDLIQTVQSSPFSTPKYASSQRLGTTRNSLKGRPLRSSRSSRQRHDIHLSPVSTPRRRRALQAIEQMEGDEEMARKLQEEMDFEYAMTLHNSENDPPSESLEASSMFSPNTNSGSPTRMLTRGMRRATRDMDIVLESLFSDDSDGNVSIEEAVPFTHMIVSQGGNRRGRQRNRRYADRAERLVQDETRRIPFPMVWNSFDRFSHNRTFSANDYEDLLNIAELLGDVKPKGLSQEDVIRLPEKKFQNSNKVTSCSICMSDFSVNERLKILPCFHEFHGSCIERWIVSNATCPICRVEVSV